MKHNISRGKPDKRQMFEGMRNLESQSFGGDLGLAECEEWALQGHVKGNDRDDFDPKLHDPMADRAVSVEHAGAGTHSGTQGARPYSWRHSRVRHPHAGARLQFAFPWSFSALYTYSPAVQVIVSSAGCLPTCPSLAALPALAAAEVQPDESSDWPDPQRLSCAFCCNKRNSLEQ